MGLESRDYYRDGSYTATLAGWGVDFTPVVKYLIIANVVVFVLQVLITGPAAPQLHHFERAMPQEEETDEDRPAPKDEKRKADERRKREEAARKAQEAMEEFMSRLPGMRASVVQKWLELDPKKTVEQGQLWRLLTCAFCHHRYDIWHILFNMLALYWFGTRLERMYGSREFLLFYLAAAICASVAYVGLAYYTGSKVPALGASGAVMAVIMLYVIYYPFETFLLFWFVPVPLWAMLALYVLYDLHPVLLALAGDRLFTGVAHAAHLGGLAFGFLYWRSGVRLERVYDQIWRAARHRKAAPLREPMILPFPQREDLADRVDEILKKISEQGKDSLTEEERDVLIRASAKYRDMK
jgi:membrane associated rhomboid family serine protease